MEVSELASTQSGAHHQSVLVSTDGSPLKINLQAVELEGRPKLVRTLKGSGALVVSNAREAAIILVDSATESGKRLIRTWGHDASKVVLEHTWIRACMNAGRPLLQADNWGGAMTIDDGKPVTIDGVIVDEDELEEVEALVTKSPLPTPRVTPVDPTSQPSESPAEHPDVTRLEAKPNAPSSDAMELQPPEIALQQPVATDTTISKQTKANVRDDMAPPQSVPPPQATQPLPYPQPTLPAQPSQTQNGYAFVPSATQQPYFSSQSRMVPTQLFSHNSIPSSQQQTPNTATLPNAPSPSVPSQTMQMTPNATSVIGANLQNPDFATLMTIMEVVRHMDHSSWFGQNQLPAPQFPQTPINSEVTTFSLQLPGTPTPLPSTSTPQSTKRLGVDTSLPSSRDHIPSDTTSIPWDHASVREFSAQKSRSKSFHRTPNGTSSTSTSRKRPPVVKPTNPPPKRRRKGKERAISTESFGHSMEDEPMEDSDASYSTHSSTSLPERSRNIIARKKHGEIFSSESGQSLQFFVQVDLHGRHAIVTNIKKNMGKIVNNIADADYLILSPRSDTFPGLLNEALALGKSPIMAAFVADCVEEGALLDETDYVLESVAKIKALKRGRQNAFSVKVETSETYHQIKGTKHKSSPAASDGRKSSKTSTGKEPKRIPNTASSKPAAAANGNPMISRSPTPPPASARQMMKNGKYVFTQEEDEYILCLAKHHLSRDPTISNTALVGKLHKKMPHHTAASWAAHIDQKLKKAVEDVRKRANIAKRKRDSEAANQNSYEGFVDETASSKGYNLGITKGNHNMSSNPSRRTQDHLEQKDFEVITQFFASGGGDDDDDERVWQELEKYSTCKSASSWPEYYAAHQEGVYARIEELMSKRVGD